MYRSEMQRLEGVWNGTERVSDTDPPYEAAARIVFQTVFDGKFLLCDYVQTAPDKQTSVAHGVFRRDERTNAFTVTWFRSPVANSTQQADAVSEGDEMLFVERIGERVTRTKYAVQLDKLTIRTELSVNGDWQRILDGEYRRR
jgi:hypothetical protein